MLKLADSFKDSWHSHFIELVRARGYTMLYPSVKETLAKVYSEFSELLYEKDLPHWSALPLKDLWGEAVSKSVFEKNAMQFRLAITCRDSISSKVFEADDLFCTEHDSIL
ncbi:hypothetical protein BDD12DRAFT_196665 [Trichophaea hybrida]|nr:hypothetical protein BDD12DRAFT_196665 [Trichophaea hybrida]